MARDVFENREEDGNLYIHLYRRIWYELVHSSMHHYNFLWWPRLYIHREDLLKSVGRCTSSRELLVEENKGEWNTYDGCSFVKYIFIRTFGLSRLFDRLWISWCVSGRWWTCLRMNLLTRNLASVNDEFSRTIYSFWRGDGLAFREI